MALGFSKLTQYVTPQIPWVWADYLNALFELAIARMYISFWQFRWGKASPRLRSKADPSSDVVDHERALVERVACVIPRVAARVPWKSDCLVQALAAQRWLRSARIKSTLSIGIRLQPEERFEAHAWLSVGSMLVTGGEITGFNPFALSKIR